MNRLYETTFTVAAGTALAAPQLAPVALEDASLVSVRIVIPDGHNGLTGLQVRWAGTQVIPFGTGTWITANDEVMDIPWDGEITATGLALAGYNTDVFAHSFYLRWLVEDLAPASTVTVVSAQASGPAAVDSTGVADLTASTAPDNALADFNPVTGDTGQVVPDVALTSNDAPAAGTADSTLVGAL